LLRKKVHGLAASSGIAHLCAANLNLMSLNSKAVGGREVVELLDEVEASIDE
jgi:hypothetical protein